MQIQKNSAIKVDSYDSPSDKIIDSKDRLLTTNDERMKLSSKIDTPMMSEKEILVEINNAIESIGASGEQDTEVCAILLMHKFSEELIGRLWKP